MLKENIMFIFKIIIIQHKIKEKDISLLQIVVFLEGEIYLLEQFFY